MAHLQHIHIPYRTPSGKVSTFSSVEFGVHVGEALRKLYVDQTCGRRRVSEILAADIVIRPHYQEFARHQVSMSGIDIHMNAKILPGPEFLDRLSAVNYKGNVEIIFCKTLYLTCRGLTPEEVLPTTKEMQQIMGAFL